MDSHSRWDEVKAKRRPPNEDVRASIERELVQGERSDVRDEPEADGAPSGPPRQLPTTRSRR